MAESEVLGDLMRFAQNEPQLALMLSVIGAILVFFFINMIGGDGKKG